MGIPAVNQNSLYVPDVLRTLNLQTGTGTLVAGTATITGVNLTGSAGAGSFILITMRDPGAGALTTFVQLDCPIGTRTATQFVVNAIDNTKATLATAVCTFDWLIIG